MTGEMSKIEWYTPKGIDSDKKEAIRTSLFKDAARPLPSLGDDPYWFGLRIARFARLVLIAEELNETKLA